MPDEALPSAQIRRLPAQPGDDVNRKAGSEGVVTVQSVPGGSRPQDPVQSAPRKGLPATRLRQGLASHPVLRHLAILAVYIAAGIAVTWPRATYLTKGRLPFSRDGGAYVWGFWWMAHQVEHLSNPWFTRYLAAPVGTELGYHALLPLEGVLMMPVTIVFGPSASYNVLSILMPGLTCYAMYRVARLWLRSQAGAIAAGGFYGLSPDLAWHAWYQLNLAAGVLFLPLALEAAVRLRRRPGMRQAVILGVVVGAALLTDQESTVLVGILVAAVLVPWLVAAVLSWLAITLRAWKASASPATGAAAASTQGATPAGTASAPRKLAATAAAVGTGLVIASPQLAAMVAQARHGGTTIPGQTLARYYVTSGTSFPGLFAASPRLVDLGLTALRPVSFHGHVLDGVPTFGLVLSVLAAAGLAVSWRRRSAWLLALLWLATAATALGSTLWVGTHVYIPDAQNLHGIRLSGIMPFTWFVKLPGLAGFREAARLMLLALVPAALLAGAAIDWLRYHWAPLIVVVGAAAAIEAGWAGTPGVPSMPTALPALDRPIAADHSGSVVVDVPFGIRGGVPLPGEGAAFYPESEAMATADGHPRAVAFVSRLSAATLAGIRAHAFYDGLLTAQGQSLTVAERLSGTGSYWGLIAAARRDAQHMHVGWAVLWHRNPHVVRYLTRTGFHLAYKADGVPVYRLRPRQSNAEGHDYD
jgi:hypothetical protein